MEIASSCQGKAGCAMMIGISGKSTATSVNWHRIAILQAHAAAARHAAADPAVSCMKDAREAGLRKYFVERIGDPVAGRKLLQGRMKFQAVNPARRHPTARLGDRLRATV